MAYISFECDPVLSPRPQLQEMCDSGRERLSRLEWIVVALAAKDHPSTLRRPGRIAIAMGELFGRSHNPRLADPKLEALRRVAVLTWHQGALDESESEAFEKAGFTLAQLRAVGASILSAKTRNGLVGS